MIFDFIINVISFLINALAGALPTITVFPVGLATQISTFVAYAQSWDWIFPVDTIFTILGILVFMVFAEFVYFTGMYVLSIIHATVR